MSKLSMNPRAQFLIADLELHPHPVGGYYREIYRSASRVITAQSAVLYIAN
ncbi:MAG: cupin domain-containing protein [Sideroxyarcus sp.]